MQDSGLTYDQALIALRQPRDTKVGTSHPTDEQTLKGNELQRLLIETAEIKDDAQRAQAVQNIITEMMGDDIWPQHKDTTERVQDRHIAASHIHNEGANEFDYALRNAMADIYGKRPSPADLTTQTGREIWGGSEADGKPNAEAWTQVYSLARGTYEAMDATIKNLQYSKSEQAAGITAPLSKIMKNLSNVIEKSDSVIKALENESDAQKKQALYTQFADEFFETRDAFSGIYDDVDSDTKGENFYNTMLAELAQIRENEPAEGVQKQIEFAESALRRNGFILAKEHSRISPDVLMDMADGLFADLQKKNGHFLGTEQAKILKNKKFSDLKTSKQYKLINYVVSQVQYHPKANLSDSEKKAYRERRQAFEDILDHVAKLDFPSGNKGYPSQLWSFNRHLELASDFPLKWSRDIISEAEEVSPSILLMLFAVKNIKRGTIMSLHEAAHTLDKQGALMAEFSKAGGNRGQQNKFAEIMEARDCIMRACSDSSKTGGEATIMQAFDVFRDMVRASIELYIETGDAVALEPMLGCGMSLTRFGGNTDIVQNIAQQELAAYVEERGESLNFDDENHHKLAHVGNVIMFTEQGRQQAISTATSSQIAHGFMKSFTNMIGGALQLFGFKEDVIAPKPKRSAATDTARKSFISGMIGAHSHARFFGQTQDGQRSVLDRVMDDVSCPIMTTMTNIGNRPGARSTSTAANVTGARAIGNDQSMHMSELFMNGWYGAGKELVELQAENSPAAIKEAMNDPEMKYGLERMVAHAGRARFDRMFKKLSMDEHSFNDIVALGKSAKIDGDNVQFTGNYTEEQAYLAHLYYDRLKMIACLDAHHQDNNFTTGEFDLDSAIQALKPKSGYEVQFSEATLKANPAASSVIAEHEKNRPSLKFMQDTEDYIDDQAVKRGVPKEQIIDQEFGGQEGLYEIAAMYRQGSAPHIVYHRGDVTPYPKNDHKIQPIPKPDNHPDRGPELHNDAV